MTRPAESPVDPALAAQVAQTVSEAYQGAITAEDFTAAVHNAPAYAADYPFTQGAYDNSLEGFLFPKTYEIMEGATADTVLRQMLDQYRDEAQDDAYRSIDAV